MKIECSSCKRDNQKIIAKGMCRACYQRWYKRGTTDYAPKRVRQFCHIKDCDDPVVSHGLCDKHRQRLKKHGHVEQTRPDSWGAKEKHPLRHSWRWLRRYRGIRPVSQVWLDDFLQFVTDVGERPSPSHRLFPIDESIPIGNGNFAWRDSLIQRENGESRREANARSQRLYRELRPESYKGYDLKRGYGISYKEYAKILVGQGGVCAICKGNQTDRYKNLSVDHCHETGAVRGLLCSKCNLALGGFKDSPELLDRAKDYLLQFTNCVPVG